MYVFTGNGVLPRGTADIQHIFSSKNEKCGAIYTYSSNKIITKVALNVSSKIQRKAFEKSFFIDPSSSSPLILIIFPYRHP